MDTAPRTGVSSAGAVVEGAPDADGVAEVDPALADADAVVTAELAAALPDVPVGEAEVLAAPPVEPVHPVDNNNTPAASAAPTGFDPRRIGER